MPDKEFEVLVIKMLTELRRLMDDHRENFKNEVKELYFENCKTSMKEEMQIN